MIELLALDGGHDVLALVIYERRSDELTLRTALGEFADVEKWRVVDERRPLAAIATFTALARRVARRDKLRA